MPQIEETPTTLTMTVKPKFLPPGLGVSRYTEHYQKDGSLTDWRLRRDLRVGKSYGNLYFTADGTLIYRLVAAS